MAEPEKDSPSNLIVELLAPRHNRASFSCGAPALDDYLQRRAGQDMRRYLAVCYVLCERESQAVLGYYTLSATTIEPTALPPQTASRLGRYHAFPATLLGRLAVAVAYHGKGLGELLLADALRRAARTAQSEIGSFAVVVDALDERAANFYEHFGFLRLTDDPHRLYLPMQVLQGLP